MMPRASIAALMGAVVIIAVNASVFRTLLHQEPYSGTFAAPGLHPLVHVCGLLPLGSLLVMVALLRVPEVVRRQADAPFFFGFSGFGWASILGFVLICDLAPGRIGQAIDLGFQLVSVTLAPVLSRLVSPDVASQPGPAWLENASEIGIISLVLSGPELLLALVGGWLFRKSGISLRIEMRQSTATRLHEVRPETAAAPKPQLGQV